MSKTEDNFSFNESRERIISDVKNEAVDKQEKYDPLFYCRTCANKDDSFVPIFKGEGLYHQLNKKIEKYLPIHVSRDDNLPLQLCYNCASTIIAWDTLVVGCVEAEKKLNSLRNTNGNYISVDPGKNQASEEPCSIDSEGSDSDDEPLITKKLAIVKNSRKRKVIKKNDVEKSRTQPSLQPAVENEASRVIVNTSSESNNEIKENSITQTPTQFIADETGKLPSNGPIVSRKRSIRYNR